MNYILFYITTSILYIWIFLLFVYTSRSRNISDKKPICCYELYSIRIPVSLLIISCYLAYFTHRYNQCVILNKFSNDDSIDKITQKV